MAAFSGSVRDAVGRLLRELPGSEAAQPVADTLVQYAKTLAQFGAHTDLVGARSAETLVEIALADAVILASRTALLPPPWCEVGAGGASLLVPLALMIPSGAGTLFEPRQKRAAFLRLVLGTFSLHVRLHVDQRRVEPETLGPPQAHTALARAVLAPPAWLALGSQLVGVDDPVVLLTTSPPEALASERVLDQIEYRLPWSRAARCVTWVRAQPTAA